MGKVVINTCYGGFGLSAFAVDKMEERGYKVDRYEFGSFLDDNIPRHNPDLIAVVEELGEDANGFCAELTIVEFDGNVYRIDEYDGYESVITPEDQKWIVIE